MGWGSIYKYILCLGVNREVLTLPKAPFTLPQTGLKCESTSCSLALQLGFWPRCTAVQDGGGGRIRTPGRSPHAGFQNRTHSRRVTPLVRVLAVVAREGCPDLESVNRISAARMVGDHLRPCVPGRSLLSSLGQGFDQGEEVGVGFGVQALK